MKLKLTIISINLNNLKGLKETVKSVQNQTCQDFEYIIIDGASKDGSIEFIKQKTYIIDLWKSEKDTGVYNAMNKGIEMSNGQYLLFLNSGDVFSNDNVIKKNLKNLDNKIDIIYGNVNLVDNGVLVEKRQFPDELTFSYFLEKTITHQVAFIKKRVFEDVFYYSENFKMISDWELFICAICKFNKSYKHINLEFVNYDVSGMSSLSENQMIIKNEKRISIEKHFPLFIDDYNKKEILENKFKLNRFKMLIELEKFSLAKKINTVFLRTLLFFFNKSKQS